MNRKARLFVEGEADKKFIHDYISFLMQGSTNDLDIIRVGGWTEIPKTEPKFKENSNDNGVNLLILDADNNPPQRREQILNYKKNLGIEFELFLLPNNVESGSLESLLCEIINTDHQLIFDCFDSYQECLKNNPAYQLPNLKSRIYAYLEALLAKNQSELLKDSKRNYKNTDHWNLEHPYLNPLKEFLILDDYAY
ncbi:hypothetical protein A2V82_14190 [candidate division KSB1 bacterium RBG_16_48_16]|nr:MAG: hypothetical protein A2V82_14190 [candidate division KSB1 bacterium RBG_16_48_16]